MNRLSPYSIPPLISALLFFVLGAYVYFQRRVAPANRAYAYWCLLTFYWQISWFVLFNVRDPRWAWIIVRLGYTGISFLPAAYFHFVVNFLGVQKRERIFLRSAYFLGFLFTVLLWSTRSYISGYNEFSWGYYPKAGIPLHPIFLAVVAFHMGRPWWLVYVALRNETGSEKRRNQLRYVLAASMVYSIAATDFLVNYGFSFYPSGVFPIILSMGILCYAVVKYRLMEITVFIRRAVLLSVVYLILLLCITPVLFSLQRGLSTNPSGSPSIFVVTFIFTASAFSVGPFIYAYFVKRSRYFRDHTIAGITHELKSPLAAIDNAIEMLSLGGAAHDSAQRKKEYLEMIERNSARLRHFVEDLLQAMKSDDEERALSFEVVDPVLLCKETSASLQSLADARGNRFIISHRSPVPPVSCDRQRIFLSLSNILSNANKYSENNEITIDLQSGRTEISISVRDHGCGIPRNELQHVFDRFYQGASGKKSKGTGLGLTIAKVWIEAHGGRIWAESDGVGKGTTVSFTVPMS